jgi:hypothetical protein
MCAFRVKLVAGGVRKNRTDRVESNKKMAAFLFETTLSRGEISGLSDGGD